MELSYVIVTHSRRERLLKTLAILRESTPLPRPQWEVWVVDNGSDDGTCEAVAAQFPEVHTLRREMNEGVWARSYAFGLAVGRYVVLLDDDSYPVADAVARSIRYLDENPKCAAVVGRCISPAGVPEACAFPTVMLSGAVCIRRSVLMELGGFRKEFFRKAGEYDLSFRIWDASYSIERFDDIVYIHDKELAGRSGALAHRMDVRNNLILVERYLPKALRRIYREDWTQRYLAYAQHAGWTRAARRAIWEARLWRVREAVRGRHVLSEETIEQIFELEKQARAITMWARAHGVRRVVIADYGKNLYATYQGCLAAGLKVVAIADENPALVHGVYRGVVIAKTRTALAQGCDGVVVSNINPAQVDGIVARIGELYDGPVLRLWEPRVMERLAAAA